MNTTFLLMAQYEGRAIIPVEAVCRDYFAHLTPQKFLSKVDKGQIAIPVLSIENSQKSAKGVHINDLAEYLDKRREEGMRDFRAMHSR